MKVTVTVTRVVNKAAAIVTVANFKDSAAKRPHSAAERPHSAAERAHSAAIRPHRAAEQPHSAAKRPHSAAFRMCKSAAFQVYMPPGVLPGSADLRHIELSIGLNGNSE